MNSHFIGRYLQRNSKKGFVGVDYEDILLVISKGANYIQEDGRFIYFDDILQLCCIQDSTNKEFISFLRRKAAKKGWNKI